MSGAQPSGDGSSDAEKRLAAEAAAELVAEGMKVGLGTGSTVAYLLPALARRGLDLCCVATSRATAAKASALGLKVVDFENLDRLDIAIDGADQVTPDGWLVKGGGGAHVREKVVAAAADRFVVIVSGDKLVDRVRAPVPVEILAFGVDATLRALGDAKLRGGAPASPDGGLIADWFGDTVDPAAVSAWLDSVPGVVGHGLFPPEMVSDVVVARGGELEHRSLRQPPAPTHG